MTAYLSVPEAVARARKEMAVHDKSWLMVSDQRIIAHINQDHTIFIDIGDGNGPHPVRESLVYWGKIEP